MKTHILPAYSPEERVVAASRAAELLRKGEIVALPTETVYGLAADALNADAVLKIFTAKERPRFNPLIVHLPNVDWLERVAVIDSATHELVGKLTKEFWPGPLTVLLQRRQIVSDLVTAGLERVALRVSAHPVFSEVIKEFGGPLAAPSANRFGRISPTAAAHVLDELDGRVPLVVDAGPTEHGIESTIVALWPDRVEVLRRGPISAEQLSKFGPVVIATAASPKPEAPGQLPSHYAPRTQLIVTDDVRSLVVPNGKQFGLLAWSAAAQPTKFAVVRRLTSNEDFREAASNLFHCLRELDQQNLDLIVAEKVPDQGLGSAIMDRLRRAATR